MESLLVALDKSPEALKSIHYIVRLLAPAQEIQFILFHVLPTTSPDMLKKEEMQRIEGLHSEHPHLSGYFWRREEQERMEKTFHEAKHLLLEAGFSESRIRTHFAVDFTDVAQIIVNEARRLECATIVLGRRGVGRVKEFLLGSVSSSTTRIGRGLTVWVVD
ncbi:MAG: universal stress protein [Deltaproteobacteria bacterium]|nr:universal stress protein [Deltaproteobacteria bacterium]